MTWGYILGDQRRFIRQSNDGTVLVNAESPLPIMDQSSKFSFDMLSGKIVAIRRNIAYKEDNGCYRSDDGGYSWNTVNGLDEAVAVGHILANNTVLLFSDNKLFRSTDGVNFTGTLLSEIGIRHKPYYTGIDSGAGYDAGSNEIVLGEYGGDAPASLWRSSDGGITWAEVLTVTENIRHFHTVSYDRQTRKWYATSGDEDTDVHWWVSDDRGLTWTKVLNGSDVNNINPQLYRTLGMVFTENGNIIWSTDNTFGQTCGVYTVKPSDIYNPIRLTELPSVCYGLRQNGAILAAITRPAVLTPTLTSYLYVSFDSGKSWLIAKKDIITDYEGLGGYGCIYGPNHKGDFYINHSNLEGFSSGTMRVILN